MFDFSQAKVLIVGDIMLDRYWNGSTSRISPEAPVPIVHVKDNTIRAGGAGNVALNVSSLGGQCLLLGLVGQDEQAQMLADLLHSAQVQTQFITTPLPTITKLRILSQHQQLIRLDFEEHFHQINNRDLFESYRREIEHYDVVVLSDYGKGTLSDPRPFIELALTLDKPVLVDPKGSDFNRYRGASLLTPNRSEFEAVVGACPNQEAVVSQAKKLRQDYDLSSLLVTQGEHGMTLIKEHDAPLHIPTRAKEVFDVTGAGDTVIATLATALASGQSLAVSTQMANAAAGVVVGKIGTATVSPEELSKALHKSTQLVKGVVNSREALAEQTLAAQSHGESIVFTNGCFDILHVGHIRYLQEARKLGDYLIVAINDDASISRLKGPERPINTVADRSAILAALACVDWVIAFSEDTPEPLLKLLKPDVLVKGGDYQKQEIVGHEIVESYGGKVLPLVHQPSRSTTDTINKIQKSVAPKS